MLNLFDATGSTSLVLFNSGLSSFINDGNNFGIGTTSPANSFVVKTGTDNKGIELISATDKLHVLLQSNNGIGGQFLLKDAASTNQIVLLNGASGHGFYNTGGKFHFGGTSTATEQVEITGSIDISGVYKVGGVAGVSFGPSAVTSITVVGGIITAIS